MRLLYVFLVNVLRLALSPLWLLARALGRPRARWLSLTIRSQVLEVVPPRAFWLRFVPGAEAKIPTSLPALRRLAEHLTRDPRVEGVVVTLPPLTLPWARARSLREVFETLRAAGKRVVMHLPEGGGHATIYVASAASQVLLGPSAAVSTLGLSAEVRHYRDALAKIGVELEPFARREYKTALERFTASSMSEPQREQLGALLDTFEHAFAEALAQRGIEGAAFDALFTAGLHRGEAAVRAGLADGLAYADELPLWLGATPPALRAGSGATSPAADPEVDAPAAATEAASPATRARELTSGASTPAPTISPASTAAAASALSPTRPPKLFPAGRYLAYHEARFFKRFRPAPHIALVAIEGTIMPGHRADKTIAALRIARRDPRVRGVILYVDSPGGSALTSDLIHREVVRLRERKPVVACFDGVAASGGYYVAAHADAIVARPTTITGSIGVIAGRLLAKELLERVGVRTEIVRKRPHADLYSPARPLEDDERAILERELDGIYGAFVGLVAEGRRMTPDAVDAIARGRVWSGADAVERGLVDRLGGVAAARDEVLQRLAARGPHPGPLRVEPLHPTKLDVPPPEPVSPVAALLASAAPELGAMLAALETPERGLLLAPSLPRIV
ncbi:MAG: signal peptide peptidase SppA [Myxococcales bacterium]|nr:signal peptide peptidase SppA [Myxococcales bacterium]